MFSSFSNRVLLLLLGCTLSIAVEKPLPPPPQSEKRVDLSGHVLDDVQNRGIVGATVTALDNNGQTVLSATVSGPDGSYSLTAVTRNASVRVLYSKLGYTPNPEAYEVTPKPGHITQDARLLKRDGDYAYWQKGVNDILTLNKAPGDSENLLRVFWDYVRSINVTTESRVLLAKALSTKVRNEPGQDDHTELQTYARVDLGVMNKASAMLKVALNESSPIPSLEELEQLGLPRTVVFDLASQQVRSESDTAQKSSLAKLEKVWGQQSIAPLSAALRPQELVSSFSTYESAYAFYNEARQAAMSGYPTDAYPPFNPSPTSPAGVYQVPPSAMWAPAYPPATLLPAHPPGQVGFSNSCYVTPGSYCPLPQAVPVGTACYCMEVVGSIYLGIVQ